jgi:RNA polymerase sigma-70 factor (ECF subfamily)
MTGALAAQLSGRVHVGISVRDFANWMTSEQRRILLLCRRMLGDNDEADSATQEVFLKAYKSICQCQKDFAQLEYPDRWLTRIAVNTCLDLLRSNAWKLWRRRPAQEEERVILEAETDSHPDAERQIASKQILVRLEQALVKLSPRQRAVFTLRHFNAMSLDEIADVLKLDTGTVKAHLFRALSKLRSELHDLYSPASSKHGSTDADVSASRSREVS